MFCVVGKINLAIVVDYNIIDNHTTKQILKSIGVQQVVTFSSPEKAYQFVINNLEVLNGQLVVFGIHLPVLNEMEFVKKIRRLEKKHTIKLSIIFIASSYFPIEIVKFKKRNTFVIEKPLTIKKLIESVEF